MSEDRTNGQRSADIVGLRSALARWLNGQGATGKDGQTDGMLVMLDLCAWRLAKSDNVAHALEAAVGVLTERTLAYLAKNAGDASA